MTQASKAAFAANAASKETFGATKEAALAAGQAVAVAHVGRHILFKLRKIDTSPGNFQHTEL